MALKQEIRNDLKEAMKVKDEMRTGTLRMLLAALMNKERESELHELSDEEVQQVMRREIKKRKQAAEAFEKAGRAEQAEKEKKEAEIIERYLCRT